MDLDADAKLNMKEFIDGIRPLNNFSREKVEKKKTKPVMSQQVRNCRVLSAASTHKSLASKTYNRSQASLKSQARPKSAIKSSSNYYQGRYDMYADQNIPYQQVNVPTAIQQSNLDDYSNRNQSPLRQSS